jgi:Carboxypeptidase regulatory-like domain
MRDVVRRLMLAAALICLASASAFAQGSTTSSISGTVVDAGGGVIPGATVLVKNNANGTTSTAVTNASGTFSIPALEAGTYTVTVSLSGFKSSVLNDVRLTIGTQQTIKATLEVGNLTETVEVRGGATLVNTATPTISSTLNADQINKMPMATRNALNAVTFLPGVNTATTNRDSNFNGLPDSFVAISLDGVNNNDNFNKSSEGLFAMVTPRQDAVEAVTVTTAGNGADIGGHGAVQVAFVTRSGTNRFTGSGYHYFRDPWLNTNYWFNENAGLPKNDVVLNQYGIRQGGPIVIPGVYDGRGKAFFFFNYEELRLPPRRPATAPVAG